MPERPFITKHQLALFVEELRREEGDSNAIEVALVNMLHGFYVNNPLDDVDFELSDEEVNEIIGELPMSYEQWKEQKAGASSD